MKVLVIDIGGSHVKVLATGHRAHRKFDSGPTLTPRALIKGVKALVGDWQYDVVSIGYPGPTRGNRPILEPHNLGTGWTTFNYRAAFGKPVRIVNDAVMQAMGSYKRGRMLFLGLGTGLGTVLMNESAIFPLELAHLPYKKNTYEDYVGTRGLKKFGRRKWKGFIDDVVQRFAAAFQPDDLVLGGGNVHKLDALPAGCRRGDNNNAFIGGFELWRER